MLVVTAVHCSTEQQGRGCGYCYINDHTKSPVVLKIAMYSDIAHSVLYIELQSHIINNKC